MAAVVIDSDFLSSFLKIKQLPLVRNFYQTETLWVPTAVYREVAVTTLLPDLAALDWVKIHTPTARWPESMAQAEKKPDRSGSEAIARALERWLRRAVLASSLDEVLAEE